MKTQPLRKSYKSFLTESKCSIEYSPLNIERIASLGFAFLAAICFAFYRIEQAIILWQCVFMLIASMFLIVKLAANLLVSRKNHLLTISLPEKRLLFDGQVYQTAGDCRKSWLGVWLTLKPEQGHVDCIPKQLFIPNYQLNRQQIAYLSYLVKSE